MVSKIRWGGRKLPAKAGSRVLGRNSNQGRNMYTGTLIRDLTATVERAELRVTQRQAVEEMELQRMFELQEPPMWSRQMFAGAA